MRFEKGQRLAVIAAHPDDEVLGCGGTIARAVAQGMQVGVLFLGEGVSARFPVGQYESEEFKKQTNVREQGARSCLKTLGVHHIEFEHNLCGQFDQVPMITLVKRIEAFLETFKADILLTHSNNEVNIDHRITYTAVETACRPTRSWLPKEIYTFEIVCSGNWTFGPAMSANTYVDITAYWKTKLEAWHRYEGESRPFPFPRSDAGLETLARMRGMAVGVPMAEAFCLVRKTVV